MRFPSQVLINGLNLNRMGWGRGTNTSTAEHFSFYQMWGKQRNDACMRKKECRDAFPRCINDLLWSLTINTGAWNHVRQCN